LLKLYKENFPVGLSIFCIPLAYFLGSINAASIIAWIFARIDMRKEPDGRISASEVHHKLGLFPFFLTVLFDALLAMSAVLIANYISQGNKNIMMLAGVAAMTGHNWSMFLKFKGGLGATAVLGIFTALYSWMVFIALCAAIIIMLINRKSTQAFVVGLSALTLALLATEGFAFISIFPMIVLCMMMIKKYQVKRTTQIAD
jgi:glycerol-3-phosphate acyltransferase PlsY